MDTQLISKTTVRAAVVGNPDTIFVLPNQHRIAVQVNTDMNYVFAPDQLAEYLNTWSKTLEPKATVAEYASSFMAFVTGADHSKEFLSDFVWEALRTYFAKGKFDQELPADFDILAMAEDRPALDNYDYVALADTRNFERLKQELDQLPFSVKDQNSELAKVTEEALKRVLKLADPETNEFFAQDFGSRLLDLVEEYGTRILFWYQQNFETKHHITFIGFGSDEFEPQAVHVRYGGQLGAIPLTEFSDPFREVWLQDTTYPKRWYGDKEVELWHYENELQWRLRGFNDIPAERTLELVELKRAAKRFLTNFEPSPIAFVNITKEEIIQK
jgi:hypothetical protein